MLQKGIYTWLKPKIWFLPPPPPPEAPAKTVRFIRTKISFKSYPKECSLQWARSKLNWHCDRGPSRSWHTRRWWSPTTWQTCRHHTSPTTSPARQKPGPGPSLCDPSKSAQSRPFQSPRLWLWRPPRPRSWGWRWDGRGLEWLGLGGRTGNTFLGGEGSIRMGPVFLWSEHRIWILFRLRLVWLPARWPATNKFLN